MFNDVSLAFEQITWKKLYNIAVNYLRSLFILTFLLLICCKAFTSLNKKFKENI